VGENDLGRSQKTLATLKMQRVVPEEATKAGKGHEKSGSSEARPPDRAKRRVFLNADVTWELRDELACRQKKKGGRKVKEASRVAVSRSSTCRRESNHFPLSRRFERHARRRGGHRDPAYRGVLQTKAVSTSERKPKKTL